MTPAEPREPGTWVSLVNGFGFGDHRFSRRPGGRPGTASVLLPRRKQPF